MSAISHPQPKTDFTDIGACKPVRSYAFIFICQEGNLEIGSLLLAASLKRFLKCDYELIAAVPSPAEIMGTPNELTRTIFAEMGVRVVDIHNTLVSETRRRKYHLITNKMYCLRVPTSAEKLIFMDSDYLCYQEFRGESRFSIPFNGLKVALPGTHHYEGKWHKFYEALNVQIPNIRIRVTNKDDEFGYIPPCFNSGFVAIQADLAPTLCDHWFECWKTIDEKGLVKDHPQHIGQFALAVAVAKMNIPYEILERDWRKPYFLNVHHFAKFDKRAVALIRSLIEERLGISSVIGKNPDWQFAVNGKKKTDPLMVQV